MMVKEEVLVTWLTIVIAKPFSPDCVSRPSVTMVRGSLDEADLMMRRELTGRP